MMTASFLDVYLLIGEGCSSIMCLYQFADGDWLLTQVWWRLRLDLWSVGMARFLYCCRDGWISIWMKGDEMACLASSSALLFPAMPMWLGIQFRVTGLPWSLCCCSSASMKWSRFRFSFGFLS